MKKQTTIDWLIAPVVFILLYAAVSKLADMHGATVSMGRQPLPNWSKPILVWAVPLGEITASLFLLYDTVIGFLAVYFKGLQNAASDAVKNKVRLIGLFGALVLLLMFTTYTALAVFKVFKDVPCGCGGVINSMGWPEHFYMNIALTILTSLAIWLSIRRNSPTQNSNFNLKASTT